MRRLHVLSLVLGGLAFASAAQAEEVDNPRYAEWSKFGIGSSQTLERTMEAGGRKISMTESRTLKSVTADAITIDLQIMIAMNGTTMPPHTRPEVIKAKIDPAQEPKQIGEETIEAAGKSLKCKIFTTAVNSAHDITMNAKAWISDEVPGGLVKMAATSQQGDVTSMLTKFEAK